MTDLKKAKDDPKGLFWDEVKDIHAGMLGVMGMNAHLQPMSHHADPSAGKLWFVTKKSVGISKEVGDGAKAHYVLIGDDHDFHACAMGPIKLSRDEAVLDKLWNPVVASWFEHGKEDPDLVMLELTLEDADMWASTDSSALFGWEVAKANLTGGDPDVGVRTNMKFP